MRRGKKASLVSMPLPTRPAHLLRMIQDTAGPVTVVDVSPHDHVKGSWV
jgi:hypothetical protein